MLLHDTEHHVLIITDLGAGLLVLDQWLVPALSDSETRTPPDTDACRDVGMRVGQFLASVHGLDISSFDARQFANADKGRLVREEVVGKMGGIFERFGYTGTPVENWCATIEDEFEAGCNNAGTGVFSVGDLWTGSVLVSVDGSTVGLVDWEFAGEARPLQDMAQFCASNICVCHLSVEC